MDKSARAWVGSEADSGLFTLHNERASRSPEMSKSVEKVFGALMDMLMRMLNSYDDA